MSNLRIADARMLGAVPAPTGPTSDLVQLGVPEYWEYSQSRGEGVRVGIVDTGIDPTHPAVSGRLVGGRSFVPGTQPDQWQDAHGHGTAVAGLVAMVAPGVDLLAARVLGADGSGQMQSLADAIDWCREQGCHVINMSLGAQVPHPPSDAAGLRAVAANMTCVASAGNMGPVPGSMGWPGAYSWPAAVGALDEAMAWPAGFSSRGDELDWCAPGSKVVAPALGGGWAEWYGTSFAAPLTAGVAALLIKSQVLAHGRVPLESRIFSLLVRAARRPRNAPPSWDPALGFGLLDLRRLMPQVLRVTVGEKRYRLNDVAFSMDVPAQIVNGRTLVPLRALSEALGAGVDWDPDTRTVTIEAVTA